MKTNLLLSLAALAAVAVPAFAESPELRLTGGTYAFHTHPARCRFNVADLGESIWLSSSGGCVTRPKGQVFCAGRGSGRVCRGDGKGIPATAKVIVADERSFVYLEDEKAEPRVYVLTPLIIER